MKPVTKLMATIVGTLASLFTAACEKPTPSPQPYSEPLHEQTLPEANDNDYNEIYGPPSMLLGEPDGDEAVEEEVVEEPAELPQDRGFVAEPMYGVKIAPTDDKPHRDGNNNRNKDVDNDDDEDIKAYREATKPKPVIVTKYGIQPRTEIY